MHTVQTPDIQSREHSGRIRQDFRQEENTCPFQEYAMQNSKCPFVLKPSTINYIL
jgi:hypothetical protein